VFIARTVCGVKHVTIAALFCSSSLLCISNSDWATENEAGRSVSVNGNEEPAGEICHQYSSVLTAIIPYSRTIKLQYTLLADNWECVRPARPPVLTWVPSSRIQHLDHQHLPYGNVPAEICKGAILLSHHDKIKKPSVYWIKSQFSATGRK